MYLFYQLLMPCPRCIHVTLFSLLLLLFSILSCGQNDKQAASAPPAGITPDQPTTKQLPPAAQTNAPEPEPSPSPTPAPGASGSSAGARQNPEPAPPAKMPLTLIRWLGQVRINNNVPVNKQLIAALNTIQFKTNADLLFVEDPSGANFVIRPENFEEDPTQSKPCTGDNCALKLEAVPTFSSVYRKIDKAFFKPDLVRSNQVFQPAEKSTGDKQTPAPRQPAGQTQQSPVLNNPSIKTNRVETHPQLKKTETEIKINQQQLEKIKQSGQQR